MNKKTMLIIRILKNNQINFKNIFINSTTIKSNRIERESPAAPRLQMKILVEIVQILFQNNGSEN